MKETIVGTFEGCKIDYPKMIKNGWACWGWGVPWVVGVGAMHSCGGGFVLVGAMGSIIQCLFVIITLQFTYGEKKTW